jgi:hypothetical protein
MAALSYAQSAIDAVPSLVETRPALGPLYHAVIGNDINAPLGMTKWAQDMLDLFVQ